MSGSGKFTMLKSIRQLWVSTILFLEKIYKEFGCLAAYICSRISNDGVIALDFEVLETPDFIKEFVSSFYKEFFLEKNLEISDLEKIK